MIISVTERGSFKRCRRAWDYSSRSRQNMQPLVSKPALEVGSLIHKAHASWLSDESESLVSHFMTASTERLDAMKEAYMRAIGAPMGPDEVDDYLTDVVQLGHAMCINYQSRWHKPLPDGFRIISPEQTFLAPIPGTEHKCSRCLGSGIVWKEYPELGPGATETLASYDVVVVRDEGNGIYCLQCPQCKGTGQDVHYLEGTLDGLLQDEKGYLYILEHKTWDKHPSPEALATNDQFLAYLWILQQAGMGTVGGIAYDGMWKRLGPPRGRTFEDLFYRVTLQRPPEELAQFGQQLAWEAQDMASVGDRVYPNLRWEGCYDCAFKRLCIAQSRGENTDYVRATFYTQRPDDKGLAGVEAELSGEA